MVHESFPPPTAEVLGKRGRKPTDKKLAYDADYVEEPRPVRKVGKLWKPDYGFYLKR